MTGRPYDEDAEPRVLAATAAEDLSRVAVPWAATEELWGSAGPTDLAEVLGALADLARRARAEGGSVYCGTCV